MTPRIKYLILLMFACHANLFAQISEIEWVKVAGGSDYDHFEQIIFTIDSNYLAVGYTGSNDGDIELNQGSFDFFAVKIDSLGNVIWKNTYGGSQSDICYSVVETDDGNYLLAGESFSNDGDVTSTHELKNVWLVLLGADGNLIWQKTYGGSVNESAKSIIKNAAGNYVICGETNSNDGNVFGNHSFATYDYWVFEIDASGVLINQKCYGGSEDDKGQQLVEGVMGGYFITGNSKSNDGDVLEYDPNYKAWSIKTDTALNIEWQFTFGGADSDFGSSCTVSSDSGFAVTGETFSDGLPFFKGGLSDGFIVHLDSTGYLDWVYMLGGSDIDKGNEIYLTDIGNPMITGRSESDDFDFIENYGDNDIFITELTNSGEIIYTKSFGGSEEDFGYSLMGNNGQDAILAGVSMSSNFDIPLNNGAGDAVIIKLGICNNVYFSDADLDGFGDISNDTIACNIPFGFVSDSTDCDDTNSAIHPMLTDICNSIDDNCNGITDEDATFVTYFLDNDGDLFGDELMDSISCNILIGYVENNLDCNDANPEINPTALEICNGIDDNCNTDIDEGLTIHTLYADADGDTYGNPDAAVDTCIESIFGYVTNSLDCNDTLTTIYPGATELCNYLDEDCDGLTDENLTYILTYQDNDGDNFGNPLNDSLSCELPVGYVEDDTDCDDTNTAIYPGAEELLNGIDDDCDQTADEGLALNDIVKNTISIYPNPTTNILFIQSNANYTITILNQLGEVIQHSKLLIGLNTIDVEDFASGVYWVQVENGEMVVWVKD